MPYRAPYIEIDYLRYPKCCNYHTEGPRLNPNRNMCILVCIYQINVPGLSILELSHYSRTGCSPQDGRGRNQSCVVPSVIELSDVRQSIYVIFWAAEAMIFIEDFDCCGDFNNRPVFHFSFQLYPQQYDFIVPSTSEAKRLLSPLILSLTK